MKRVKNRGFILVETMVVSIFVMAIFVFVYRNSIPMMGRYQRLNRYDDLDGVYAANMVKKMVTSYLSFDRIDNLLVNSTYVDVSNCSDTNLYSDAAYCTKLKKSLQMETGDVILITRYNPSEKVISVGKSFRDVVQEDIRFDSGSLSSFREYLRSVTDSESFYSANNTSNKAMGVYRIYITRSVRQVDGSTRTAYSNIGVYRTNYAAGSVSSVASINANGPTLVLNTGENYQFTSFLQIKYASGGGTTTCSPANNITVSANSSTVTCVLRENNGNELSTHFTLRHGYDPTLTEYSYACEDGNTCVGVEAICDKGGTYDATTNKCLY